MIIASTGPYVLIAVVAYMAGVIVTVALIRSRKKDNGPAGDDRENAEPEEDSLHGDREILQGRKS